MIVRVRVRLRRSCVRVAVIVHGTQVAMQVVDAEHDDDHASNV